MSSLNVHDINGISTYGNEVRIPSGSNLNVVGEVDAATVDISTRLDLPVWTNATRPSNPAIGTMGYNNDTNETKRMEFYNGTEWVNIDKTEIMGLPVTAGLQVWMDGDTWSSSNNRWEDKSGNNNHSQNTTGTVTQAAKYMDIPKSMVSRRIKRLEQNLGTELFQSNLVFLRYPQLLYISIIAYQL